MRPDGIAEERLIGASLESVLPRVLPIGPSDGEIFKTSDIFVDDGAVAHCRADHPETATRQADDYALQDVPLDRHFGAQSLRLILLRRSLQFTE